MLVDLGYSDPTDPATSYANIPTPAGLFSLANPFTVVPDLLTGAVQGPYGAAVEIGVESGLLSPSYFPDTYPWVPSIDPGLNIFLGQPSTTGLSDTDWGTRRRIGDHSAGVQLKHHNLNL